MNKDILAIFEYLEREKGIKREAVVEALEMALQAAAKKTLKNEANVFVQVNSKTGDLEVFCEKEIVDSVENPSKEISLKVAKEFDPECEIGQFIDMPVTPKNFGRIAAQTARQVISQKLRVAERDVIYQEYRHRENEIVSGVVKRVAKGGSLIVDLGKVEAILPRRNFPQTEEYRLGDKVYALLFEVQDSEDGGAAVILTRNHVEFVKQLFLQEIPELQDKTIEIKMIAREPGYRTKMVVSSSDPKVDPVGACVGMRGSRIKNVIRELNNEKIDVVTYSPDPVDLLQSLLSPIEIRKLGVNEEESIIAIVVEDTDFGTVIGKKGFNAKLIGEILGYELEVQRMSEYNKALEIQSYQLAQSDDPSLDEPLALDGLNKLILENIIHAGYDTPRKLLNASIGDLASIPGVSLDVAYKVLEEVSKSRSH